ncbi:MAG: FtsK/SpoIIIE domain-containing protein [Thiothrix sp.]|uniref:FtsK/SpoIIIE domain-containing protein n=1 Tax=Thiothrix sp. TaxID=1032 RepID=UPI00261E31CC|nr:FtsK/SpoIIIE domain-containing protein [Thiothrix sp.]MDD5392791.1 FtsK/SpoIIIE domain-containing protein [Thiothrix sp.]
MSLDFVKTLPQRQPALKTVIDWCAKHKIGVLPEAWRTAKPNPADLVDMAKPTLVGIPALFVLYLIWEIPGFATGLAIIVAIAILDATRPLRGGHWLAKPEVAKAEEIKHRFLVEEGMDPDKWWGKKVQDALNAHGVKANVVVLDTSGATLDMYELEVQQGFDINNIATLGDNFARSLKLPKGDHITVDANIGNGRAALYIPKTKYRAIRTLDMLQTAQKSGYPLPGLVGEDLVGNPVVVDITHAPHLLVGGEVGMERAGQMLNILLSTAYSLPPDKLRITLIDPKVLELAVCNSLPHVTEPVIIEMHKAYRRLLHIREMMNQRCQLFAEAGVNNIAAYNRRFPEQPMPYQLIAFSELTIGLKCGVPVSADDDREVGEAIKALLLEMIGAAPTQEAGIHFLFGIQCYDPKTCGEALRHGIPSSIGMRVRAHEFSELLIGQKGCETLGEQGECYVFMAGDASPKRALAAAISGEDIEQAVLAIREKWLDE